MINTSALAWIFATQSAPCVEPYEKPWAPYGHFESLGKTTSALNVFEPPPIIQVVRYAGIDDIAGLIKFLPVAEGGVRMRLSVDVLPVDENVSPDLLRSWMIANGVPGVLSSNALYVVAQNTISEPVCPDSQHTAFPAFDFVDGCVEYGGVARAPASISGAPVVRPKCSYTKVWIIIAVVGITVSVACIIFMIIARDLVERQKAATAVPPPYSPAEAHPELDS